MSKQKQKRKIIKEKPLFSKCQFCESKTVPTYKEYETLSKYLSDRGRIYSRERSRVCAKHQRKLAQGVKRARFLSLLPY